MPESEGPTVIGRGKTEDKNIQITLKLVAYYCKNSYNVKMNFRVLPGDKKCLIVTDKMNEQEVSNHRLES